MTYWGITVRVRNGAPEVRIVSIDTAAGERPVRKVIPAGLGSAAEQLRGLYQEVAAAREMGLGTPLCVVVRSTDDRTFRGQQQTVDVRLRAEGAVLAGAASQCDCVSVVTSHEIGASFGGQSKSEFDADAQRKFGAAWKSAGAAALSAAVRHTSNKCN